ncbi:MAG: DUF1446 domain-containing protein [Desulfurococcales archaeon]|nr:DUF1446 domain-containing protein [Desulfurococcales archaeon]
MWRRLVLELRVYSPTAILGYGFPDESLENAVKQEPDVIAVDAGSSDPGPYYLGSGKTLVPDESVVRDLERLLVAQKRLGVPLLIGSAGGAGAGVHVDHTLQLLDKAARRAGGKFRVKVLYSDLPTGFLEKVASEGRRVVDLGLGIDLRDAASAGVGVAVAQNGVEPLIEALRDEPDVVLAGRSVDVAPFAALPWFRGFDRGLSVHMGKVLECGAIAADPGSGADGLLGVLRSSEFLVKPLSDRRRTTVVSVAEHALYERSDPYREYVPGGYVDLTGVTYEEGEGGVVVRGSKWVPADRYMVKLEGARLAGHRYIVVAGARDPGFISRLEELYEEALRFAEQRVGGGFKAYLRMYGWNGVLGRSEPLGRGHEIGLVLEVVSRDKWRAEAAAGLIRSTLLHMGWPGRKTTAGNLAFPFSPSDIYAGEAYEWSLWHLVELRDPLEVSRMEEVVVGG